MKDHTFGSYTRELKDEVKGYIEAKSEYTKLAVYEKAAFAGAKTTSFLFLGALAFFTLFFVSIALAVYLANLFQSLIWGFTAVAGLYLALTIIVFVMRKKIFDEMLADSLLGALMQEDKKGHEESAEIKS